MKYRGGNYNIGISVYFQAMFIEYKVFTRGMWLGEILRKFMKKLFFGLQQHLILRKCLFVRRDERKL